MSGKLTIGLPVMLHQEKEIQAFLAAKERIEKIGNGRGHVLDVGAFLFFVPPAMKEEALEKQLENQQKYAIPIVHAQSTFQSKHCLGFSSKQDPESGDKDLINLVVNHVAALRAYDPIKFPVDISVNVGIYLCRREIDPKSPVIYTLDEFLPQRDALYERSFTKFSQLEKLAQSLDLGVAIENGITACFAPHIKLKDKTPTVFAHPFNDFASLVALSDGKLVLDAAHWAGTHSVPEYFERNKMHEDIKMLFALEGIHSWGEYHSRHPALNEYFPYTRAFHISNATGPGIFLGENDAKKWGDAGTIEGIVPREDFHAIVNYAKQHRRPLIMEVDYDLAKISENQFREADEMIEYMLI